MWLLLIYFRLCFSKKIKELIYIWIFFLKKSPNILSLFFSLPYLVDLLLTNLMMNLIVKKLWLNNTNTLYWTFVYCKALCCFLTLIPFPQDMTSHFLDLQSHTHPPTKCRIAIINNYFKEGLYQSEKLNYYRSKTIFILFSSHTELLVCLHTELQVQHKFFLNFKTTAFLSSITCFNQ